MKKIEKTPYEFYLYINNNIVCQRYFQLKGYNEKVLKSVELKELIDEVAGIVQKDLENKTRDYLYMHYNPFESQDPETIQRMNIYENEDVFDVEVRVHDKIVAKKRFTGNVYPPKVRYSVNIKELIPVIISTIQEKLSQKKYTQSYAGIEL
jgi:calcineurin-like phosphoesterase family protein